MVWSAVCVLPTLLMVSFKVPFYFGGTSVLIVVGVAQDMVDRLNAQLVMRNYEGIMETGGGSGWAKKKDKGEGK